jgi:hypothetical protein
MDVPICGDGGGGKICMLGVLESFSGEQFSLDELDCDWTSIYACVGILIRPLGNAICSNIFTVNMEESKSRKVKICQGRCTNVWKRPVIREVYGRIADLRERSIVL